MTPVASPDDTAATPGLLALAAAIPKVELHCHLLGTVRKATFEDLARRTRAPLSQAEIDAFYTRGEKPVGVLRVLRALDQWLLATPDDFHRITLDYLQDAAAHNVRHAEFFWNPTGTVRHSGLAYAEVQAAIVRAIDDARHDLGISARLVPSIDRQAPPADAVQMVQWMLAHRHDAVPGIGIDYHEVDHPPEHFAEAYALARRAGLKTTAHAGEFGTPWRNVHTAITQLEVDRVDHGYTATDDGATVQLARERGLVFTVVPTNSYYLRTLAPERWALDHPIRRMLALGLRLHPNTDDPTLHHVTPSRAWQMMVECFGCTTNDLRAMLVNGLDAAWIDSADRQRLLREHTAEFDTLRQRLLPADGGAAAPEAPDATASATAGATVNTAVRAAVNTAVGATGGASAGRPSAAPYNNTAPPETP